MSDVIVNFYCMRHGEKNGDKLTERGSRQVSASAKQYLTGVVFDTAYASEMVRAQQTAARVLAVLGQQNVTVFIDRYFGYEWFLNDFQADAFPFDAAEQKIMAECKEAERAPTVMDYLQHWPPACAYRVRMTDILIEIAIFLATDQLTVSRKQPFCNVLVASHSPICETAAFYPRVFPRLNEADIAVHTIKVESKTHKAAITHSQYLPCPSVD